jgi:hypothetical protein
MVQIQIINAKEPDSITISFFPCIVCEKTRVNAIIYYNLVFIFLHFGIQISWKRINGL